MLQTLQNLDWTILEGIRNIFGCRFLDALMPIITRLGDAGLIWIAAGLVLIATKKYRRNGVMLLCALLCGALIGNVALKHLIARSRPCWIRTDVPMLIAVPKDYSFPSGHTLSSVIAAACLARTDRRFGYIAIPLAAAIAFSRLYLFVHFPTDVLAAAALGIGIAAAVYRLFPRRKTELAK